MRLEAVKQQGVSQGGLFLKVQPIWNNAASPILGVNHQVDIRDNPVVNLSGLVNSSDPDLSLKLVLPTIAEYSLQNRWVALISPPYVPTLAEFEQAGVDVRRVLVVHVSDKSEVVPTMDRALRTGTCTAVFAWSTGLAAQHSLRLKKGAVAGETVGVLFCDTHEIYRWYGFNK